MNLSFALPSSLSDSSAAPVLSADNLGSGSAVVGTSSSLGNSGYLADQSAGVSGTSRGFYGVYGSTYNGLSAVHGENTVAKTFGDLGTVNAGVSGEDTLSGNSGDIGDANEGVYGRSPSLAGVVGISGGSNTNSIGVYGLSSDSRGVEGQSSSSTGVVGISSQGIGVTGSNTSNGNEGELGTSNYGVYGDDPSSNNYGDLGDQSSGVSGFTK